MASKAPSTLKRFLPAGALRKRRVTDQRYPKNGARTKWAASTKKSFRLPALASSMRGSSSFVLNSSCFSRSALAGIVPTLRLFNPFFSRNFRTWVTLRLTPVSSSILLIASLIEAGGCSFKYASIVEVC